MRRGGDDTTERMRAGGGGSERSNCRRLPLERSPTCSTKTKRNCCELILWRGKTENKNRGGGEDKPLRGRTSYGEEAAETLLNDFECAAARSASEGRGANRCGGFLVVDIFPPLPLLLLVVLLAPPAPLAPPPPFVVELDVGAPEITDKLVVSGGGRFADDVAVNTVDGPNDVFFFGGPGGTASEGNVVCNQQIRTWLLFFFFHRRGEMQNTDKKKLKKIVTTSVNIVQNG